MAEENEDFTLSEADVKRLTLSPSADVRADTAKKIALSLEGSRLTQGEKQIAEDVVRILIHDAEVIVRKTLSENLKDNPYIPHDVASILARDVEEVALPIIHFSKVLTDEDLIEIVNTGNESKTLAVASREEVDEKVCEVIAEKASEEAVAVLAANDGAKLQEKSYEKILNRFPENEKIQKPIIERAKLPAVVVERLIAVVSDELKEKLIVKHDIPADVLSNIMVKAREETTIIMSSDSTEDELMKMIRQMHDNHRLTPSLIIRAVCMGDLKFFEYSMSELSGIPVKNCRLLIHDSGELGFSTLYEKTDLPERFFPIFRAAIDVISENDYDGGCDDIKRFTRRTIERILIKIEEAGIEMDDADVEYLLGRISLAPLAAE